MALPTKPLSHPRIASFVPRTNSDASMPRPELSLERLLGEPPRHREVARLELVSPPADTLMQPTAPAEPRLVATAEGKIHRMLLTIPNYALFGHEPDSSSQGPVGPEDNPLAKVYRDLFHKLEKDVELVILTHKRAAPVIHQWLKEAELTSAQLCVAEDFLGFSIWAEDGYVGVQDRQGRTYLMQPYSFPRYADGMVALHVANVTDLRAFHTPLYFQGGNVLVGDDFFLIGADYPARSLRYLDKGAIIPEEEGWSRGKLYERILQLYGANLDFRRRLIPIGSSLPVLGQQTRTFCKGGKVWTEISNMGNSRDELPTVQPLFHIDMFLTLLGRPGPRSKYRVAVGDPAMAAEIIKKELPEYELPDFAMPEVFDDIARTLALQHDFEVVRTPLPLVYADDEARLERRWYFATSNNCLVQFDREKPQNNIIWMPTYGYKPWEELKLTDAKTKEIYEGLGFKVRTLTNFHPFAENLGAMHCIKKYLRRG